MSKRLSHSRFGLGLSLGFLGMAGAHAHADPGPDSEQAPDFVVDAANGNDANSGSPSAPWASLNKLNDVVIPVGATRSALVVAGNYNKATDYIDRTGFNPGAGSIFEITFEPGCVMDGTAANESGPVNATEFPGADAYEVVIYGNGLIIQHYNNTTEGASPNGIGNRGNNTTRVHSVHVVDCPDAYSAHGNARMYLYDCTGADCSKAAYTHVDNAIFEAYRCTFTGRAGAVIGVASTSSATASSYLEECIILPAATGQAFGIDGTTLVRCQVGTPDLAVTALSQFGGTLNASKSFVNLFADGDRRVTLRRCYGKFSTRVRNGGNIDVQHCVFSAPATGQTAVIFSNFNPPSGSKLLFKNNIVKTATATAFMSVDATNAGYLVAAGSELDHNVLSGAAAFDADYVTADASGTGRTGTVTADALIGAANTLLMADYAFAPGSPAIGAASDGSDSGFGLAEVEERLAA